MRSTKPAQEQLTRSELYQLFKKCRQSVTPGVKNRPGTIQGGFRHYRSGPRRQRRSRGMRFLFWSGMGAGSVGTLVVGWLLVGLIAGWMDTPAKVPEQARATVEAPQVARPDTAMQALCYVSTELCDLSKHVASNEEIARAVKQWQNTQELNHPPKQAPPLPKEKPTVREEVKVATPEEAMKDFMDTISNFMGPITALGLALAGLRIGFGGRW